jgi:hypothetical protein
VREAIGEFSGGEEAVAHAADLRKLRVWVASLTIACLAIGLFAVGAYFSAVADDPCIDRHSSASTVALFIGAVAHEAISAS